MGSQDALQGQLAALLANDPSVASCQELAADFDPRNLAGDPAADLETLVYLPARSGRQAPDPAATAQFCQGFADADVRQLILISSAAINEPSHRHPGHVSEVRLRRRPTNAVAQRWLTVEQQARQALQGSRTLLTILRPAAVPVAGGQDLFSRLLTRRIAVTLPGFDPSLQFLSLEDLARAVRSAAVHRSSGVYNVAPAGVIPLRQALRQAGGRRLPVPGGLQRLSRRRLADELNYLRYPWTISGDKIRRQLGFEPRHTSAQAVASLRSSLIEETSPGADAPAVAESSTEANRSSQLGNFDEYGMDRAYIDRLGRTLFRFLHDVYWRIEWRGIEHLPEGKAVLAGVHRGHQPWDGVMLLHLLARELGRYPRFLIHPTLVKHPMLAPYMIKCGGIHACQQNADWVLSRDELLAIFPEGIRGAFTYYREAYQLGNFGRDDFVKIALRHGAPIVPFVTLGSAEIFPIYAKLHWRWWIRYSEWPCLPITPTMSLLPLPSKWHTLFLEPIDVAQDHGPDAARDPAIVKSISQQVRSRMEEAIATLLKRRKSIYRGSIFEPESSGEPVLGQGTA